MQDSLSFALTQISYLVFNINKRNFSQNTRLINKLVQQFGLEADRHYLRCLFSSIDFGDIQAAKASFQAKLLSNELTALLDKPSLISNICYAFDNHITDSKNQIVKPNINQISKALNFSTIQEVALSIALQYSSTTELAKSAENHLKICLSNLLSSYINFDTSNSSQDLNLNDISPELLQLILSLLSHDKYKQYNISEAVYNKFTEQLCKDFPKDRVPLILAPLLYDTDNFGLDPDYSNFNYSYLIDSEIMDTSWSNLIVEIGYAFTANVDECKNHLSKVGGRDLAASDVARLIALMCRTHTNLSDSSINLPTPSAFWNTADREKALLASGDHVTWKPDVFVQALKEIAPNIDWKGVCLDLDHPDFLIKDRAALNLLLTIFHLGQGNTFPAECLYRHWSNVEGQLSLIATILKNPDLYCFADHIFTSVSIELLKTPPEMDNKEIAAWKSLHLIDVLLFIGDSGLFGPVSEIFKLPLTHCPDVLFMALLQINPPITPLRQELFNQLLPIFLANHPNSGPILHHAWNAPNFNNALKLYIMQAMSDWYVLGDYDQSRLTRILDVAQDLKALSNLLNVRSFMFVIDLACLASRREYLKLEKWLSDKIREHGEPFVQAIAKFLQRRCPQIMGIKVPEDQMPKSQQLPQETLVIMLTCLQAYASSVTQPDLSEAIITMTSNCNNMMMNKNNNRQQVQQQQQQPPGVIRQRDNPFSAGSASMNPHLFNAPAVDAIASGLNASMAGLNLSGPAATAFNNYGNMLGNLGGTPASPSRLLGAGPSNSPFPMPLSMPGGNNTLANRMAPTTPINDKISMPSAPGALSEMTQNVSKEVEDEANSYFQRIYNVPPHPTLSIDEVLDMLQRFQESTNQREREVYQCMLRNLFEEYKFFPQYPDKELQITAQLFGGMIERHLVTTYVALGLALRCVLDALKKPEGSKMYYFGITALDKFKTKLYMYQKYCEHVRSLPNFSEFPSDLIQYVEYGFQGQEPPNKPQSGAIPMPLGGAPGGTSVTPAGMYRSNSAAGNMISTPTSGTVSKSTPTAGNQSNVAPTRVKSIANATNIDTLLVAVNDNKENFTTPPEAVQEKTAFIFNNLSQLNLTQKCEEIKEILQKDYYQWLSNYLVLKRASIELNFHGLYSNFLDALKIAEVNKMVTKETFRNIKVLLRSDKGIANFSDRSLLKNLGHWLGMLTLARNKPILQIDIDLKSLLVEAYNKGQQELLYTVPFVAKVLESCAKSKVFKPPNPWTMAIMNVLAELHQEPELKLNLKFEIEVLCKNLSIDVSDLKPVVYLKDPERLLNIEYQLSQPTKQKEVGAPGNSGSNVLATLPKSEEQTATTSNITSASPSIDPAGMLLNPPEPRFGVMDINVTNIGSIAHQIVYNPNITLFLSHPQLKAVVRSAIERTINEWISPVVDRSVKIALKTSEQIVRKDFALEPDENRLRSAAHNIVRNLAAGMAMHTCRDQLLQNLQNNIKSLFLASLNPAQKDLIDAAAAQIAADNTELACVFIQKTAMEKAVVEMDKVLTPDYEARKVAMQEGRRFYDGTVLAYQNERLPETIRLKIGNVTGPQLSVYEEFARNIPGFQPILDRESVGSNFMPKLPNFFQDPISAPPVSVPPMASVTPFNTNVQPTMQPYDELSVIYDEIAAKIETFMNAAINNQQLHLHLQHMNALFEYLINARRTRDNTTGIILLKKSVEGLMEGLHNIPECVEQIKLYRDIHLRILRLLQDNRSFGAMWTNKAIAKLMIECREENRYNTDAIDLLISSNFVHLPTYDQMLAALIDNGNNYMAVTFAMHLIQMYFIDERAEHHVTENDFLTTIDLLVRLAPHPRAPEGLTHLIDLLRSNQDPSSVLVDRALSGPTSYIHSGMLQARTTDVVDVDGFADKTEHLFRHWVYTYHNEIGRDPVKYFGTFVNRMNFLGVLKGDEQLTKFFTLATKMCIEASYRNLSDATITQTMAKTKTFHWIDAYVRLIALLVRHSGDGTNSNTKLNLLNKVLGIVVGILLQDQEQLHGANFQQFGYQRIFIMLFLELSAHDAILENISVGVVTAFCHTYHMLRPANAPGFCYAWLELISNRVFIGRILAMIPQQKGWFMYSQLLIDLFKYLAPFLRNAELAKPVTVLYKGTLRVLLVLLHDFPEFLCDYHFGFCDVIPPNCIQMRNLILSAYPRNMRLPDPFTPNLKVSGLPDITTPPRICTNYTAAIQPASFKKDLDSYLKQRAPVTFFAELKRNLQISNEPGSRYNIPLMNALVLYVGTQAIAHIRLKNQVPSKQTVASSAHMDIFQNLAVDSDNEGRYLFLNAIANQLRYPNSHTHYFSCTLLYLFHETNSEAIQEQITRVLLERLIVNRPHPWGLLITFIELIKNPEYEFWKHDFVHCAPEIEKLFESVARSCMVKTNNQQQQPPNVENAELAELN